MSARIEIFCPAKLNLFLAVTGKRQDGYHDLVSLVVKLQFGDRLSASIGSGCGPASLTCSDRDLPVDAGNLVLKAAQAFSQRTGWQTSVEFHLSKAIPVGAGLGGGSSDAAGALLLLNHAAGSPLTDAELLDLGAGIGSDVPLFLIPGPCILRGRGERVEALDKVAARRFSEVPVILYKPEFGVSTPWAYAALAAAAPGSYLPESEAEARLAALMASGPGRGEGFFNSFEAVVDRKFVALPQLREELAASCSVLPRMSGSGSCCFATGVDPRRFDSFAEQVKAAWGPGAFVQPTRMLASR